MILLQRRKIDSNFPFINENVTRILYGQHAYNFTENDELSMAEMNRIPLKELVHGFNLYFEMKENPDQLSVLFSKNFASVFCLALSIQ